LNVIKLYLAFVIPLLLLATGCNSPSESNQSFNTKSLSANDVVQNYYQCVAKHDFRSASQFLAPDLASFYRSAPDSDFNNVKSISDVVVTKPYNSRLDNKYKYEVQVDSNYTAQYKQLITVPNGGQTRFIYLGRNNENQPWFIISIGTGP
jgi:hypothetical protein